jgi:glycosidase
MSIPAVAAAAAAAGNAGPIVTDVATFTFSDAPAGDNDFLPETGWTSYDYDDGGSTFAGAWNTFADGSQQVLYCADVQAHLGYDVGTVGHEVETRIKLNTPLTDMLAGVFVGMDPSSPRIYSGSELVLTGSENKTITDIRNVSTFTTLFQNTSAGLSEGPWYVLRSRIYGGVVSVWLDEAPLGAHTLTGPQLALFGAGSTHAGVINYAGFNNFDYITFRSVV